MAEKREPLKAWDFACQLLPRLNLDHQSPAWPPDMFAICASLLVRFGAYAKVLTNWPREDESIEKWSGKAARLGLEWRTAWATKKGVLDEVVQRWSRAVELLSSAESGITGDLELCQILLELTAIADEACVGMGVPHQGETSEEEQDFYDFCDGLLVPGSYGSSACNEVHPTRVRVLPKMHTPQAGLTIRSLSHNLSICSPSEMIPKWHLVPNYPGEECLNMLVVPWPYCVYPIQFRPCDPLPNEMKNMPKEGFGFFTLTHDSADEFSTKKLTALIDVAERSVGTIHGLVLPELALTPSQFEELSKATVENRGMFLISGVGSPGEPSVHPKNEVFFALPELEILKQSKHHPWRLDQQQLGQYGLGSRLNPEKVWWEHISLENRELTFVALLPWLSLAFLVCEDLVRPDPVGDVVRAVGPNLVIALLMDGPQLRSRWPGRYAMSLADDPGSSVLSITSIGMSELSRPQDLPSEAKRNRVVALWKDAKSPSPVEIELPQGSEAVVLSVTERYLEEWTADGRSDRKASGYPALTGIHPIRLASNEKR